MSAAPQVNSNTRQTLLQLLAGGISGSIAKSAVAPLDRVKILYQTRSKQYPYSGVTGTLRYIWQHEGVRGLFRGNWSSVVRIFPYAAIQFASHSRYKKVLRSLSADGKSMPFWGGHFVAGSAAGATAVIFTYPLDLIRGRLAFQSSTANSGYTGIVHAMRTIVQREGGVRTLYSGLGPTLAGIVPYAGINFFTYEKQKALWISWNDKRDAEIPALHRLVFGAVAGAIGQTMTYPLDVVRRRMQIAGMADTFFQGRYAGTLDGLRTIVAKEGWRSLFRGISLNYIKVAPMVGISFTTFDLISHALGVSDTHHSD